MELGPQGDERLGDPDAQEQEAMHPRVTGGAQRDQELGLVHSRFAVMDVQPLPCPAGMAGVAVAGEDFLAQAGAVTAGIGGGVIAGAAEAGDEDRIPAARAEQGAEEGVLGGGGHGEVSQEDCITDRH